MQHMEGCEAVPRAKLSLCSSSSLTAVTGNISNGFSVLLQRSDLRALWGSVPILLWWGARGSQQVLGTEELGGGAGQASSLPCFSSELPLGASSWERTAKRKQLALGKALED